MNDTKKIKVGPVREGQDDHMAFLDIDGTPMFTRFASSAEAARAACIAEIRRIGPLRAAAYERMAADIREALAALEGGT